MRAAARVSPLMACAYFIHTHILHWSLCVRTCMHTICPATIRLLEHGSNALRAAPVHISPRPVPKLAPHEVCAEIGLDRQYGNGAATKEHYGV
jgi:hypothetical protein